MPSLLLLRSAHSTLSLDNIDRGATSPLEAFIQLQACQTVLLLMGSRMSSLSEPRRNEARALAVSTGSTDNREHWLIHLCYPYSQVPLSEEDLYPGPVRRGALHEMRELWSAMHLRSTFKLRGGRCWPDQALNN